MVFIKNLLSFESTKTQKVQMVFGEGRTFIPQNQH